MARPRTALALKGTAAHASGSRYFHALRTMMKLYFSPSSSSLATHIALIESGAAHELVPRLISKQETRTPEHLALNPDGKLPVLVTESGRVLTEVAATLYYNCSQVS